jgi:hypothetical protein
MKWMDIGFRHKRWRKEMVMLKRVILISLSLLFVLPFTGWGANIPAKVFENSADNTPLAVSGVKVEVLGGYGFKAVLSSAESGSKGECLLTNVPLGKEVVVRLTKPGYITQTDVQSFSDADVAKGVILWTVSEANVKGYYQKLGETFDLKKGQVYLEISDENTGQGIEGIQLSASSGKVFDLGQGEYLITNIAGASLKIGISKPGYAFDIEAATIPVFVGGMTQYFIKVQPAGAIFASSAPGGVTPPTASATGQVINARTQQGIASATVSASYIPGHDPAGGAVTNPNGTFVIHNLLVGKWVKFIAKITGMTCLPVNANIPATGVSGITIRCF